MVYCSLMTVTDCEVHVSLDFDNLYSGAVRPIAVV